MKIAWAPFAPDNAPSGYGHITAYIPRALEQAGAQFSRMTEFDWDVIVAPTPPMAWPLGKGVRRDFCWHTMVELEPIPPGWTDVINKAGLLWVPSQWCADEFAKGGVTIPIEVCGYGVDPAIFWNAPREIDAPLRVLAWSDGLYGRKQVMRAVAAFEEAAIPDSEMEVKLNKGMSQPFVTGRDGKPIPNVTVFADTWEPREVADWLRSGDVFIYASGGEGFGLMPLQAMACGCTTICADNTGMREFLDEDWSIPIACPDTKISESYSVRFGANFYQVVPDFDQMVDALRWCAANRVAARAMGNLAGNYVRNVWTWDQKGPEMLSLLERHFGA